LREQTHGQRPASKAEENLYTEIGAGKTKSADGTKTATEETLRESSSGKMNSPNRIKNRFFIVIQTSL
jgi:hypothetical protein